MPLGETQKDLIKAIIEPVFSKIELKGNNEITKNNIVSFVNSFITALKCRHLNDVEDNFKIFMQYYLNPFPMYNLRELGNTNITEQQVKDYMLELVDEKVQAASRKINLNLESLNWNIRCIKEVRSDNLALREALKVIKNSIYEKTEIAAKTIAEEFKYLPNSKKCFLSFIGILAAVSVAKGEVTCLYTIIFGIGVACVIGTIDGSRKVLHEYLKEKQVHEHGTIINNGATANRF